MKIVEIEQRTEAWHRWRDTGVSASEAIVVLGHCPYKTPYRLYTDKKGLTLPEDLDGNFYVQRGNRLEGAARRSFENRYDTLLFPVCAEADDWPFLRASFDGIDDDGIPVELKVPIPANFEDAVLNGEKSKVYLRYYPQVQQQIAVAGTAYAYLSLYAGENRPPVDFKIQRDPDLIDELVAKGREFALALERNQPPLADYARDLYFPEGPSADRWNQLAAACHRIQARIDEAKAMLEALDAEKAEAEQGMLELMGDYTKAEYGGVFVNRYWQQGSIDYKAALEACVANLDPALLETFRRKGGERVRITAKAEDKATVPYDLNTVLSTKGPDLWF